MTHASGPSQL